MFSPFTQAPTYIRPIANYSNFPVPPVYQIPQNPSPQFVTNFAPTYILPQQYPIPTNYVPPPSFPIPTNVSSPRGARFPYPESSTTHQLPATAPTYINIQNNTPPNSNSREIPTSNYPSSPRKKSLDSNNQKEELTKPPNSETAIKRILESKTPEELLSVSGIKITSSSKLSSVRKAYLQLVPLVHPDKISLENSRQAFQELTAAYKHFVEPNALDDGWQEDETYKSYNSYNGQWYQDEEGQWYTDFDYKDLDGKWQRRTEEEVAMLERVRTLGPERVLPFLSLQELKIVERLKKQQESHTIACNKAKILIEQKKKKEEEEKLKSKMNSQQNNNTSKMNTNSPSNNKFANSSQPQQQPSQPQSQPQQQHQKLQPQKQTQVNQPQQQTHKSQSQSQPQPQPQPHSQSTPTHYPSQPIKQQLTSQKRQSHSPISSPVFHANSAPNPSTSKDETNYLTKQTQYNPGSRSVSPKTQTDPIQYFSSPQSSFTSTSSSPPILTNYHNIPHVTTNSSPINHRSNSPQTTLNINMKSNRRDSNIINNTEPRRSSGPATQLRSANHSPRAKTVPVTLPIPVSPSKASSVLKSTPIKSSNAKEPKSVAKRVTPIPISPPKHTIPPKTNNEPHTPLDQPIVASWNPSTPSSVSQNGTPTKTPNKSNTNTPSTINDPSSILNTIRPWNYPSSSEMATSHPQVSVPSFDMSNHTSGTTPASAPPTPFNNTRTIDLMSATVPAPTPLSWMSTSGSATVPNTPSKLYENIRKDSQSVSNLPRPKGTSSIRSKSGPQPHGFPKIETPFKEPNFSISAPNSPRQPMLEELMNPPTTVRTSSPLRSAPLQNTTTTSTHSWLLNQPTYMNQQQPQPPPPPPPGSMFYTLDPNASIPKNNLSQTMSQTPRFATSEIVYDIPRAAWSEVRFAELMRQGTPTLIFNPQPPTLLPPLELNINHNNNPTTNNQRPPDLEWIPFPPGAIPGRNEPQYYVGIGDTMRRPPVLVGPGIR